MIFVLVLALLQFFYSFQVCNICFVTLPQELGKGFNFFLHDGDMQS